MVEHEPIAEPLRIPGRSFDELQRPNKEDTQLGKALLEIAKALEPVNSHELACVAVAAEGLELAHTPSPEEKFEHTNTFEDAGKKVVTKQAGQLEAGPAGLEPPETEGVVVEEAGWLERLAADLEPQ